MSRAAEIAANLAAIGARIDAAARRAGRDPASVTLVAVTKTKPLEDVLAAYEAGLRHFGENRVQEAEAKFPHLPADAVRHLIGPIQSNKANKAARLADVVHALDSADIARRLARAAANEGRRLAVYVEVNTGGEETKAGATPAGAPALVEAVRALPELDLRGLMAIPPPGDTRPHFVALRSLAASLGLPGLSMGMSDDFEAAIEEGATVVRVGTALFGRRS
ncbi:MAG: YggS family pyridoxal phosphate-dependent enzyme [Thermoanaerobaculia bacterium]